MLDDNYIQREQQQKLLLVVEYVSFEVNFSLAEICHCIIVHSPGMLFEWLTCHMINCKLGQGFLPILISKYHILYYLLSILDRIYWKILQNNYTFGKYNF